MKLKHFSNSVIGLVRKANEDSIGSLTNQQTNGNGDIFVVCDGMGGHVGGATASQTAIKYILQYFEQEVNPNPIVALAEAIQSANQQIYELAQKDPSLKGMGTTCTVLLCKEDKIYIAHVGDSRIYINTDKKLKRITKDHSFVQKLVDAGQLQDSEMESHPRKNELTRALGIAPKVKVEVAENPILAKNGDKFLMCSDGLCGLVNDLTIENTINSTSGLETVNELISLAENAGGNDNISAGIIEVVESPHSRTIFKDQGNKSLTATQVLDIPSKKGDRKLITILKEYKVYILSSLIALLLAAGYFIYTSQGEKLSTQGNEAVKQDLVSDSLNLDNKGESDERKITKSESESTPEQTSGSTEQVNKQGQPQWGGKNKPKQKEGNDNQFLLQKAENIITEIKQKLKIERYEKYSHTPAFQKLQGAYKILENFIKTNETNLIQDQIDKVNGSWTGFETCINRKELEIAREDAKRQISNLREDVSKNENVIAMILTLKEALKKDKIADIKRFSGELTELANTVQKGIDKKAAEAPNNNVKTDSLKKNK